jgi:hypothetical protein
MASLLWWIGILKTTIVISVLFRKEDQSKHQHQQNSIEYGIGLEDRKVTKEERRKRTG